MKDVTHGIRFQRAVYSLRKLLRPFWCAKNQFTYEKANIQSDTFLLLCNHTMDMDPIYCVLGIDRHMKFVASENLLHGFSGFFIRHLANPIPRVKGASADETVDLIIKNLKAGVSVAMFPDGNRTWDGETTYIPHRSAKVVKEAEGGLVTYRITGGYMKSPRWAFKDRKGPVYGKVVHEYTREQLNQMSEEEIYQHIVEDLYVNAFEEQVKTQSLYKGQGLAEGLEHTLMVCPCCQRVNKMKTLGNKIHCICGFSAEYGEDGWFHGENLPYSNTLEWSHFQKKWLKEHAGKLREQLSEPIMALSNSDLTVFTGKRKNIVMTGQEIRFFGDRIEIGHSQNLHVFYLDKIKKMGVFRNTRVFITYEDGFYELTRFDGIGGIKFFTLWRILTGKPLY